MLYFYVDATLKDTLLLIQFALQMADVRIQCTPVITGVVRRLERLRTLESEKGMHVWVLAHLMKENGQLAKLEKLEQFEDAYCKLFEWRQYYMLLFNISYNECSRDTSLIGWMHQCNYGKMWTLQFAEFCNDWSFEKTHRRLPLSSAQRTRSSGRMLSVLHKQMSKHMQLDTFEAFQLFLLANQHVKSSIFLLQSDKTKALFQKLLLKAPHCVRLLLGRSDVQLINKATKMQICWSTEANQGVARLRPLSCLQVVF